MKKTISLLFLLLLLTLISFGAASWFRTNPHELPVSLQPALAWFDRTQQQAQDQWAYWRDRMLGAPPIVAADSAERIAPQPSGVGGESSAPGLPQVTLGEQRIAKVGVGPDGVVGVSGGEAADSNDNAAPSPRNADPGNAVVLTDTDALIAQTDAAIARADAELARVLAGEQRSASAPQTPGDTTSPVSSTESASTSDPVINAAPATAALTAAGASATAAVDTNAGADTVAPVQSARRSTVAEAANRATARLTKSAVGSGSELNPGQSPTSPRAMAERRVNGPLDAAANQTGATASMRATAPAETTDAPLRGPRSVAEESSALATLPPDQRRQVTAMLADPAAAARLPANLIVAPDAPQPPAPESVGGRLQQDTIRHFLSGETVEFEVGRSVLTNRGRQALTALLDIIEKHRSTIITVQGHTDSVGDDASNLALSTARAITAREFLVARGVAPQRLRVQGFGERRPVASNASAGGRIQNRRIDFAVSDR